MITKQDFETLERLYTPLGKILLKHLREDHGRGSPIVLHQEQAKKIQDLQDEVDETIREFNSLESDYTELAKLNQRLELRLRTRSIF